jgi:hypothetical protein
MMTILLLLEFSKAFDFVRHELLLPKIAGGGNLVKRSGLVWKLHGRSGAKDETCSGVSFYVILHELAQVG